MITFGFFLLLLLSNFDFFKFLFLPPFSLIRDFEEKKHPRKSFRKFPLVLRVSDRSDRNSPITATSMTFLYLTIRLWARDFYEVIVDEAEGRINYRVIEIESE